MLCIVPSHPHILNKPPYGTLCILLLLQAILKQPCANCSDSISSLITRYGLYVSIILKGCSLFIKLALNVNIIELQLQSAVMQ